MTNNQLDESVRLVMAHVLEGTRSHFEDHLGIGFSVTREFLQGDIEALPLRSLTAVISLGGPVGILAAFSFDLSLAEYLLEVETAGLRMSADERPQFLLDTVAETANVVLGRSTTDLAQSGSSVVLSAPLVLEDGGRLRRPKGAIFTCVSHQTAYGWLDVDFIAPRHLFGDGLSLTTH